MRQQQTTRVSPRMTIKSLVVSDLELEVLIVRFILGTM